MQKKNLPNNPPHPNDCYPLLHKDSTYSVPSGDDPPDVLPKSDIYFHTPSKFASQALYYFTHNGEAWCGPHYSVNRKRFDSFLLILLLEGEMLIQPSDKQDIRVKPNSIILLDCYQPHAYRALGNIHFYFIHFDGPGSKVYFDFLHDKFGSAYRFPSANAISKAKYQFKCLLSVSKQSWANEELLSIQIQSLLHQFSSYSETAKRVNSQTITKAIQYIHQNLSSDLSVSDIANHVNLEVGYFSKLFKAQVHTSPHAYLNNCRIDHAKQLLWSTDFSIEVISQQCGFDSPTSFYRVFKRVTGITPNSFRNNM